MTILGILEPGDVVDLSGPNGVEWGVFVGLIIPHPIHPSFTLAIWRLMNGSYSFDCLKITQDIGQVRVVSELQRRSSLNWALGHHNSSPPKSL